ncbi:MAG: ELWxxDGT repeat protein [Gammaproteobacteria bacterium]
MQSTGYTNPVLVEDITPLPTPKSSFPREFTELNGQIIFTAKWDPRDSGGLWVKDLTTHETHLIRKIAATGLTKSNGSVFFIASKGIWKTDGTKSGTALVRNFSEASFIQGLTNINGSLYFVTETQGAPVKLWKSDGSEVGTVLIRAFDPGGNQSNPHSFVSMGGRLFFIAPGNSFIGVNHNEALWETDGTVAGTRLVKDISIENLIAIDKTLYFTTRDDTHGEELWKSDGSEIGTVMVKDIKPGSNDSRPMSLTELNGVLYFLAFDESHGQELWRSDGT